MARSLPTVTIFFPSCEVRNETNYMGFVSILCVTVTHTLTLMQQVLLERNLDVLFYEDLQKDIY